CRSASSSTNTGTTRSNPSSAARRAGWSWRRRSRRYQTIAVEVIRRDTRDVDSATMADEVRDFPLFPLGIVALPHEIVPLHIFEERYQTMIGEGPTTAQGFAAQTARVH